MKMHFEESESDVSTDTDENELYDDDISYGGDFFSDRYVCLIRRETGRDGDLWYHCFWCPLCARSECSDVDLPKGYICDLYTQRKSNISVSCNM
jgi:hypothetical protein